MSTKKIISYILCNKGIRINLYKLHFLSFNFSPQPNKEFFISLTFPPLQLNTHKEKLKFSIIPLFHPPTNFLFSYFSTPPTKLIQTKIWKIGNLLESSLFTTNYMPIK